MGKTVNPVLDSFRRFFEEMEVSRRRRDLKGFWNFLFKITAASYSLFLIIGAVYGGITPQMIRGFFILFVSVMVFIKYPGGKNSPMHRPSLIDFIFIVLSIGAYGNFAFNYDEMAWRAGSPSFGDVFWGVVAIIVGLESCRRAMSFILPIISLCALLFSFFGPYMPGILGHGGFSFSTIIADCYASMNGIFGIVLYVFSAYVALFIIMGAFFEKIGADQFFIDFPVASCSKFTGGPAKAAVFSSLLFGMISGSSTANTVATGTFTIPLMKKTGYKPEVAGAIEPAVDVGGMFMPPIMGAGAFLMAEMMRIPYLEVVKIALVPALIYFFAVLVMVHFEALKTGIGIVPVEERRPALPIFYKSWYYCIPIFLLFYLILSGRSPSFAAFWTIVTAASICLVKNIINKDPKKTIIQIFDGLVRGGENSMSIGSTAAPVGIIVGIALLTGLAFKFSALVLSYSYGFKWAAILLVMFATFVLGMGTTVTAGYMIVAILAVPAMGEMGIPLIAAHLTAFWYSQSSNITPPVCLSVFAGAAIAGAHPYKTAIHAMRFSAYMYVMPFTFVYTSMLMPKGFSIDVVLTWATNFLSTIPFAAGMTGYFFGRLNFLQRLILLVASVFLIIPGIFTDGIGLMLMAAVGIPQYLKEKKLTDGKALV
ncbi:MAG: TRAP transporter fused permease subunit [Thermodesulfobacteriota bacterium]|nr:TRAP transporter fused permease subunit [Thermodesulfobacteriota bacterium]